MDEFGLDEDWHLQPSGEDAFVQGYGHSTLWVDMKVWDYPVLSIGALIAVSFGVRRMREVYFAIACQVVYWYLGHSGPDAMWNSLAGLQAGRGNYKYVILPTLLTSYESIERYRAKQALTYKTTNIWGFYGLGYILGRYKFL